MLRVITTAAMFLIPCLAIELPRLHAGAPGPSNPKDLSEVLDDIRIVELFRRRLVDFDRVTGLKSGQGFGEYSLAS